MPARRTSTRPTPRTPASMTKRVPAATKRRPTHPRDWERRLAQAFGDPANPWHPMRDE